MLKGLSVVYCSIVKMAISILEIGLTSMRLGPMRSCLIREPPCRSSRLGLSKNEMIAVHVLVMNTMTISAMSLINLGQGLRRCLETLTCKDLIRVLLR